MIACPLLLALAIAADGGKDRRFEFEERPESFQPAESWESGPGFSGNALVLSHVEPAQLVVPVRARGFTLSFWTRVGFIRDTDITLVSGPGFSVEVGADGAWRFAVNDAERTLVYAPTPDRQSTIAVWHQVVVRLDDREARLAYDGKTVAILDLEGLVPAEDGEELLLGGAFAPEGEYRAWLDDLVLEDRLASDAEVTAGFARLLEERGKDHAELLALRDWLGLDAPEPEARKDLRVLSWNIWNGGREDGEETGVWRTIETIRGADADVVCMQETYGSGPRIADELGYYLYLRSSNLSILSRYPIGRTYPVFEPFKLGGARVHVGAKAVDVFCLWIDNEPDWWGEGLPEGATPEALVAGEQDTRVADVRGVLAALAPYLAATEDVPLVLAGDFNSESHLDWTSAAAERHDGLVVEWPVSKLLAGAGLVDVFRALHPDPVAAPGRTWSPRFTEQMQGRIDYVYYKGALAPLEAEVLDQHYAQWPSDHAAVLVRFELE